jgi:hypothetical protein
MADMEIKLGVTSTQNTLAGMVQLIIFTGLNIIMSEKRSDHICLFYSMVSDKCIQYHPILRGYLTGMLR